MSSQKQNFILIAILTMGLGACGGKNPFDRSNDPTKDFSNIQQDSEQFQDLRVEKVDNGQSSCGKIYDIDVKEAAARNLIFVEGQEKVYNVRIRSYVAGRYDLAIGSTPHANISLKKLDDQGNWSIRWTPPRGFVNRNEGVRQDTMTLIYRPDFSTVTNENAKRCLIEAFEESLSVSVNLQRHQPTIAIEGLNEDVYKSSTGKISFKFLITDLSSSGTDVPSVSFIAPDAVTSEVETVIATPSCKRAQGTKIDSTWEIKCEVDSSLIHLKAEEKDHGKMVHAQFVARGEASMGSTPEIKRTIKIVIDRPPTELPKVEPDQSPSTGIPPIPEFKPELSDGGKS